MCVAMFVCECVCGVCESTCANVSVCVCVCVHVCVESICPDVSVCDGCVCVSVGTCTGMNSTAVFMNRHQGFELRKVVKNLVFSSVVLSCRSVRKYQSSYSNLRSRKHVRHWGRCDEEQNE